MTQLIIEAAINGIADKRRNPNVPCDPFEIADDALACFSAGAAIVHNHTDQFGEKGAAVADRQLEGWRPILRAKADAIVYPTVGFGGTIEERYAHIPILAETGLMRMSVLDPGSLNLGGIGEDGLPGGPIDIVYVNTFADIRHEVDLCERYQLGPSISIFEPGFLRAALAYHRAGRLPRGSLVKFYFGGEFDYLGGTGTGVSFGLPPTEVALDAYLSMIEGTGLPWSVAVVGGDVVKSGMARRAIERGGHVRVGLEDYAGSRQPTNAELVQEVVKLAADMGRPVASCADTAQILDLPMR